LSHLADEIGRRAAPQRWRADRCVATRASKKSSPRSEKTVKLTPDIASTSFCPTSGQSGGVFLGKKSSFF
jgi:hypothetical protein